MTSREEFAPIELRWKITMTPGGQKAYGVGWSTLHGYIVDCYRRGVCFEVHLKEEGPGGEVILDEQERCIGWRSQEEVDGILRSRAALRNTARGLTDRVLDVQRGQDHPGADPDGRDGDSDPTVGRD